MSWSSQRDPSQSERVFRAGGARPPLATIIAFIDEYKADYVCTVLVEREAHRQGHVARCTIQRLMRTFEGSVYVAFITDVYSRRIIGQNASHSLHTDLASDALQMAIHQRSRKGHNLAGLFHDSAGTVQYRAVCYG